MPHLVALALLGAGLYVGYRWLSKEVRQQKDLAASAREEARRCAAEAARVPKNLGSLEWDEEAQVYRPSKP